MPGMLAPPFNEKEAFHRLEDERFASSDVLGFRTASRMLLTLLLLRTTLVERLYGSKPAHLLFYICVGNGAFYTALCSVHSRLSVSWSCWALPTLALLSVLRGGAQCALLMRTPGAELALARLYSALELLHRMPLPPLAQLTVSALPPASQCRVVNAWSAVMLGAAVPLAVQGFWELARWRAYQQQRVAAAIAATGGTDPAAAARATEAVEEEEGEFWHGMVSTGHRLPAEMLLCSSLVWCLATLALA